MKKEYSLAHLTALHTTPLELAKIAYEAGYDYVSFRLMYMCVEGEERGEKISLENLQMAERLEIFLKKTGLKVLDIEVARIFEGVDLNDYKSAFEIGKRLGVKHVLSSIWTKDFDYASEKFGELCDLAKNYDLTVELEAVPISEVKTLDQCVEILNRVNRKNSGILIDTHHFQRAGDRIEKLKKLPKKWFNYVQISDAKKEIPKDKKELTRIMREERNYIGEGELEVASILNAIPIVPYSIEIPNLKMLNKIGALAHAKKCLETTKKYCDKYVVGRK